jgi:hypothetical protein
MPRSTIATDDQSKISLNIIFLEWTIKCNLEVITTKQDWCRKSISYLKCHEMFCYFCVCCFFSFLSLWLFFFCNSSSLGLSYFCVNNFFISQFSANFTRYHFSTHNPFADLEYHILLYMCLTVLGCSAYIERTRMFQW